MKITPLRKIVIHNLINRFGGDIGDKVFEARWLMQKWDTTHGVEVSVSRFTDEHRRVVAGLGEPARSSSLSHRR